MHALPEIGVFERFMGASFPAFLFPPVNPTFVHGVDEILGIRVNGDFAGFFECLDTRQCGEDFHAVIGRSGEASAEFSDLPLINQ